MTAVTVMRHLAMVLWKSTRQHPQQQQQIRMQSGSHRDNVTLVEIGDSNAQQPEDTEAAEQSEEAAPATAAPVVASTVNAKRKAPHAKRTVPV